MLIEPNVNPIRKPKTWPQPSVEGLGDSCPPTAQLVPYESSLPVASEVPVASQLLKGVGPNLGAWGPMPAPVVSDSQTAGLALFSLRQPIFGSCNLELFEESD